MTSENICGNTSITCIMLIPKVKAELYPDAFSSHLKELHRIFGGFEIECGLQGCPRSRKVYGTKHDLMFVKIVDTPNNLAVLRHHIVKLARSLGEPYIYLSVPDRFACLIWAEPEAKR